MATRRVSVWQVPAAAGEFAPIKDIFARVPRTAGSEGSFRMLRAARSAFIAQVCVCGVRAHMCMQVRV